LCSLDGAKTTTTHLHLVFAFNFRLQKKLALAGLRESLSGVDAK
jgi:hypothetical protein